MSIEKVIPEKSIRVNMSVSSDNVRILFFIGSLHAGGKERRLIELLSYLKGKKGFELMVVVTKDDVHYPYFHQLNVPFQIIEKKGRGGRLKIISQLYKICKHYKPHFIHTWGRMQTFYALPSVIGQNISLINSQITGAPPHIEKWSVFRLVDQINFRFSKAILSNSFAGIESFKPPVNKIKVIYNGINMKRFEDLGSRDSIREKYGISTPYAVVMAASFSSNKDYDLFCKVADRVTRLRNDVTFIGVGEIQLQNEFERLSQLYASNSHIILRGRINEVEALVNVCDIGVLFSNRAVGEGISNSIMEYMSLAKPVIAIDVGGTREIVQHNENGFLITTESEEEIAGLVNDLLEDKPKCAAFGKKSREIINERFTLEKMRQAFENVYQKLLTA